MWARLAAKGVIFALCCVADAFVLHTAWTGRQLDLGQFRRGYFERFDGEVGLAADDAIRPNIVPSFLLTGGGALAMPPGLTAVAPLASGRSYGFASDGLLVPYVVIGSEAPLAAAATDVPGAGEDVRLVQARTLGVRDGRVTLVPWDATLPWGQDAARLSALHDACAAHANRPLTLGVSAVEDQLAIHLGRCTVEESLPLPAGKALVAALAGPEWMTVIRTPDWEGERWIVWPVLAAIAVKVAAMWWGLGPASAVATSGVLAAASLALPVPAALTWPLMLAIALAAGAVRLGVLVTRRIPRRGRLPTVVAVLAVAGTVVLLRATQKETAAPIKPAYSDNSHGETCAVIGYSTVKGEGLRGERGGIRSVLGTTCTPCRNRTAGLFAGGETFQWARDRYCHSIPALGANGEVIFLGGVNDDFFWGVLSLPRLFIAGQQGIRAWHDNQGAAAAASLRRVDDQVAAIDGLMHCAQSRGAAFLFLHDFLIGDIVAGRDRDRAEMMRHRRDAVEAGGGTFVDLLKAFGPEVGVAWFNDYIHLSLPAHERVAKLVCDEISRRVP